MDDIFIPILQLNHRGSNKLSELFKVTQLEKSRARTKSKLLRHSKPVFFILQHTTVITIILKIHHICLNRVIFTD